MRNPIEISNVHACVLEGEQSCSAKISLSQSPAIPPRFPEKDRGVFFWCTSEIIHNAAFYHKERELHLAFRYFLTCVENGRNYILKSECKHWKRIVDANYAYESGDYIRFIKFKRNLEHQENGNEIRIDAEMLAIPPVVMVAFLVQTFYLRIAGIPGHNKVSRKANRRLRGNKHCGGVCLTEMARLFNRTKQWASEQRKKLVKLGLCTYRKRTAIAPLELYLPEFIYERQKFIVWSNGKVFRQLTSECKTLKMVCIRRVGSEQDAYAVAQGRVSK